MDPWPLTVRELFRATEAKQIASWDHTAEIIAHMMTANGSGKVYHRDQFHPLRRSATPTFLDDPAEDYERLKAEGR